MPYRHVYQSFEVRRLLQQAEHSPSPITGVDAHSRGLHAIRTPGGVGVSQAEMMDRTHKRVGESNNAFKNRGGAVRTSTFKNVIQQADAACQALGYDGADAFGGNCNTVCGYCGTPGQETYDGAGAGWPDAFRSTVTWSCTNP